MASGKPTLKLCSGKNIFKCKVKKKKKVSSIFLCGKCANTPVPLDRCRLSKEFIFLPEDGTKLTPDSGRVHKFRFKYRPEIIKDKKGRLLKKRSSGKSFLSGPLHDLQVLSSLSNKYHALFSLTLFGI